MCPRSLPIESEQLIPRVLRGPHSRIDRTLFRRDVFAKKEFWPSIGRLKAVFVDLGHDDALGIALDHFRRALQRLGHVAHPDRQRRDRPGLPGAQFFRLIEAYPCDADQGRLMYSWAYCGPIVCRMRIATMFFDFASAMRMLMGPSYLPS